MQFSIRFAACLMLVLASGIMATQAPASTSAFAQSSLPALPAAWPTTVQLGMGDGPGGAQTMRSTAPFAFRYQYLSGGVNTGNGWSNWNPNGAFVTYYMQDSASFGMVPVFTYYQLRQSAPNNTAGDGDADFNNIQNVGTMTAYYNDLKLFFGRAAQAPQQMVVLHVEPDLWGFLEQRATNGDASTVPAQVSSTGLPELAGLPNTVVGFAQAIVQLRNTYAPNVLLGYHVSVWGTGTDILYSKPDNATVTNLGTQAGNWYLSLRANFDVAFAEYSDRDAAFKQYQYNDGGASWWSSADFSRNELFIGQFVNVSRKRVVFWQIPVGNTRMRAENNTWDHYQDNHVEWLLDDPSRANLNAYVQAGAVAFLFGRGADGATCFCDAANDGITNPAPINGNTQLSYNADDDGGFFRNRAAAYYAAGAMSLPSGGGTTATATPTPSPTTAPTRTSTPTPTATSTSSGTRTLTFDDLPNPDRVLSGQYPAGVIDWGANAWWLARPWGRFTTQSISFNGSSPTSASFAFLTPGRVVQVDAYNGGTTASTVTLVCGGQPSVSSTLATGQVSTISTGWSGSCGIVTIGSTNGWNTNFDNLVISTAASVAPTSTPTPTPTPPPTPTTTPAPSPQTVTFDDLPNPDRVLSGQYPAGVIDWGTNAWWLSGPWGRFTTQSVSFNGASPTSASFTFISPRRVVQVDAYNGGGATSTISLSCSGQSTVTTTLAAGQLATIATGWTAACSTVTVSSSNGWDTNFDNLVIQ